MYTCSLSMNSTNPKISSRAAMTPPIVENDSKESREAAQTRLGSSIAMEDRELKPVAVVGFAFKLPQGATTTEAFWQMLLDGRSAMTEVPKYR